MESITIKVKFLGIIRHTIGTGNIIVKLSYPFTIEHLINSLEQQFSSLSGLITNSDGDYITYFVVGINGKGFYHSSDFDRKLQNNDEITLMYMEVGG